jgi:hypothetical protein
MTELYLLRLTTLNEKERRIRIEERKGKRVFEKTKEKDEPSLR